MNAFWMFLLWGVNIILLLRILKMEDKGLVGLWSYSLATGTTFLLIQLLEGAPR